MVGPARAKLTHALASPMDRKEIAAILALVGGIFGVAGALMMGAVLAIVFGVAPLGFWEIGVVGLLFGWIVLFQLAGGIAMSVAAMRFRRPGEEASASNWALAGGILSVVGANMLSGALGIVAGVLARPPTPAAPSI